jgi:adenylate kinase family enzyme
MVMEENLRRDLRIHITGASGAGVTTFGKALALRLGIQFFDTDDFYWKPTTPPYQEKFSINERQQNLLQAIQNFDSWIIAGSMDSWGGAIIHLFQIVIFLYVPKYIRIQRLKQREFERYGKRIQPLGDMHETHNKFLEWAAQYDEGMREGRNKQRHEEWLKSLNCPFVRFDNDYSLDYLLSETIFKLRNLNPSR